MQRPSLMVIHSILEVHTDPRRTCPSHDVGGALQLMEEKKIIKKQDSVGTNTNQYYLGEFGCTLFDHHKLPNIDLCKKSQQDCHTKRKRQQESTSRYYIQHSQHNPFKWEHGANFKQVPVFIPSCSTTKQSAQNKLPEHCIIYFTRCSIKVYIILPG